MTQKIEKQKNILQTCIEKVFGVSNIVSLGSYSGVIGRNQFFCTALLWGICSYAITRIGQPLLSYLFGLLLFYFILAMVQKRCRDLGLTGTFCTLVYSMTMIFKAAFYFIDEATLGAICVVTSLGVFVFWAVIFIFLAYKIGKVEPDLNVRSPLLKYPLLYVGAVWLICIAATLTVNHYAGVTIPLW